MVPSKQKGKTSEEQNEDHDTKAEHITNSICSTGYENLIKSNQGKTACLLNREAKNRAGYAISSHSLAERVRFLYDIRIQLCVGVSIHICVCVCCVVLVLIYVYRF